MKTNNDQASKIFTMPKNSQPERIRCEDVYDLRVKMHTHPENVPHEDIVDLIRYLESKGHRPSLRQEDVIDFLDARENYVRAWEQGWSDASQDSIHDAESRSAARGRGFVVEFPVLEDYVRAKFPDRRDRWIVKHCKAINNDVTRWLYINRWLI